MKGNNWSKEDVKRVFDAAHLHSSACRLAEIEAINDQKLLTIRRQAVQTCIAQKHENLEAEKKKAVEQEMKMKVSMAGMDINLEKLTEMEKAVETHANSANKGAGWKVVKEVMLLN